MKGCDVLKALDIFKNRMSANGGSLKNENIRNSRLLLKDFFADDASYSDNVYFWKSDCKYEESEAIEIRLFNEKYSAANGCTIEFQTQNNTPIIVGDVIYCSNLNKYYICTESHDIHTVNYFGKLTLCNWILKWQDYSNGKILEYPCYAMNSTQYNSGEMTNRNFIVGSSQHIIYITCDENTVGIKTPRRFLLDKDTVNPTPYIVTQNDTITMNYGEKGICKITVAESVLNEKDNIELGVCDYITADYFNNTSTSDNNAASKAVIEYSTNVIKSGGSAKKFVGKFYDSSGNEIEDIQANWNIICDFVNKLEVSKSGNQIEISIDDDDYIDEQFKLVLSNDTQQYIASLIIKIESLL